MAVFFELGDNSYNQIGLKAGIRVNANGKSASAHDYRRSFGTRWAPQILPIDLQKLMRHEDISTTMKFYVDLPADELGARLWNAYERRKRGANGLRDHVDQKENQV